MNNDLYPRIDDEIEDIEREDTGNIVAILDESFRMYWICKVIGYTDDGVVFEVDATGFKYDGLRFECSRTVAHNQLFFENKWDIPAYFEHDKWYSLFEGCLKQAMRKWRVKNEYQA